MADRASWVPLAQTQLPPQELLRQCRERIEQQAKPEERDNLLAVTQVMTSVRYNDAGLLSLFGGRKMIIETPLMQEILHEQIRDELQGAIVEFLRGKFEEVPEELTVKVRAIQDVQQLRQLISVAARCSDLDAFRAQFPS